MTDFFIDKANVGIESDNPVSAVLHGGRSNRTKTIGSAVIRYSLLALHFSGLFFLPDGDQKTSEENDQRADDDGQIAM